MSISIFLSQIHLAAGVNSFEVKYSRTSISRFCAVYSSHPRCVKGLKSHVINGFCACSLPERNWGNPSHESISSDALKVEQAAVKKQQQDDVLTDDEAPPTLPNHWDVLETWRCSNQQSTSTSQHSSVLTFNPATSCIVK